jgi:hypothetical protein
MSVTTKREAEGVYRVYLNGRRTQWTAQRNDCAEARIRWMAERDDDSFPIAEGATKKYVVAAIARHLARHPDQA